MSLNGDKLMLVTYERKTVEILSKQIRRTLSNNNIGIDGVTVTEFRGLPADILLDDKTKLILCTCNTIKNQVYKTLGNHSNTIPIMAANMVFDYTKLVQLFSVPSGSKALLVTGLHEASLNCTEELKHLGLCHIRYTPYAPNFEIDPSAFDLAITPGKAHLVPYGMPTIDIGGRLLDISSLTAIMLSFDIPLDSMNHVSSEYALSIINLTKKLVREAELTAKLKGEIEVILDNIDNGIIAVTQAGEITYINYAAKKIIDITDKDSIPKRIEQVMPELESKIKLGESHFDHLHNIRGINVVVSVVSLPQMRDTVSHIITLRKLDDVQASEYAIRRQLCDKGHYARYDFKSIIGMSDSIRYCTDKAKQMANRDYTLLILGESGTGKELFAHAIHNASPRRDGPFVTVNFAATPENLAESELFGYEEGAFTGARRGGKPGLFELAHGGSILLDEIADAPLAVQMKLLRVIEEREVIRVGGTKKTPVDVRIIAATNRDLGHYVKENRFREDLYYRLFVLPIYVPPLRQRPDDIPVLLEYFLYKYSSRPINVHPEVIEAFQQYYWPGNVRQLSNMAKFICTLRKEEVRLSDLPDHMIRPVENPIRNDDESSRESVKSQDPIGAALYHFELYDITSEALLILHTISRFPTGIGRRRIAQVLKMSNHNISEARVRTCMKHLSNLGCVRTGRTKQGTIITSLGRRILREMPWGDTESRNNLTIPNML